MPHRFNLPADNRPPDGPSKGRFSLASMFRRRLIGAGLATVLVAGIVQYAGVHRLRHENNANRLTAGAQLAAEQVAQFITAHQAALLLVSGNPPDDPRWPQRLAKLQQGFPALGTLLVTDQRGRIASSLPANDREAGSLRGRDVSHRSYFIAPMATRAGHVSDVFRGHGRGHMPLVAISAPLLDSAGVPQGVVEGSISAPSFDRTYASALKQRGVLMLILDRQHRVVYASEGVSARPMDVVKGLRASSEELPTHSGLLTGGDAYYGTAKTAFGWTVAILEPTAVLETALRRDALNILMPASLALLAILLAATLFARQLSEPIRQLSLRMRDYTLGVEPQPSVPRQAPTELQELGRTFNTLAARMNLAFDQASQALDEQERLASELGRTLAERDSVIAARTAELCRANEELHHASRTDALTGCRNYRGFREDLPRLLAQCRDEQTPVSVIACDIDFFKRFNDRYGHPAGDACLQRIASAMRGALYSPQDVLARVGGEEFVVLMPLADASAARAVAERMRLAVQSLGIPHEDSPFGVVTLSIGAAVAAAGTCFSPDELLKQADNDLYQAKVDGRNQVFLRAIQTVLPAVQLDG